MALEKFPMSRGAEGVKATLLLMKEAVLKSDSSRKVKATAHSIIKNISPADHLLQAKAITAWVKRKLHYVRDIYGVEEVTSPERAIENIEAGTLEHSSDCDDYSVLLAALLRAVGFPTRLEAVAYESPTYNHARVSARIYGVWRAIEGTKPRFCVGQALSSRLPVMAVEI